MDHLTHNVRSGDMGKQADFYERLFKPAHAPYVRRRWGRLACTGRKNSLGRRREFSSNPVELLIHRFRGSTQSSCFLESVGPGGDGRIAVDVIDGRHDSGGGEGWAAKSGGVVTPRSFGRLRFGAGSVEEAACEARYPCFRPNREL